MSMVRRNEIQDSGKGAIRRSFRQTDDDAPDHSLNRLKTHVDVTGSTLGQVELDYLQHIALSGIYFGQAELANTGFKPITIYFKGGTALQKAGFTDRFSWDFDFSANHPDVKSVEAIFRWSQDVMKEHGYESTFTMTINGNDVAAKKDTIVVKLRIKGPSYIKKPKQEAECVIGSDLSYAEAVYMQPISPPIIPPYSDIKPYFVTMMHPTEIIAEKIRAIMTRNAIANTVKDSYDIWILLSKGYEVDPGLVALKMGKFGESVFDKARFTARIQQQEAVWDEVIEKGSRKEKTVFFRIQQMPNYEDVKDLLLGAIRA